MGSTVACLLKYTLLSPKSCHIFSTSSDNLSLIFCPGSLPNQPSFCHILSFLNAYDHPTHSIQGFTRLSFSHFIKSETTHSPFKSRVTLIITYLLYSGKCLFLPFVDIHTRLEWVWDEWRSKNWPYLRQTESRRRRLLEKALKGDWATQHQKKIVSC